MTRSRLPRPKALVLATAVLMLAGCSSGTPQIEVTSGPQATVPLSGSSQIVFELRNNGDEEDVLVGAETAVADAVEIHMTSIDDGHASMHGMSEVAVPPGESVRFQPGGLHLMMAFPDESVVLGSSFDLTLRFERSGELVVPVEVVDLLDMVEAHLDETADEP